MMKTVRLLAVIGLSLVSAPVLALPTIIVDRAEDGTTVYFGLNADALPSFFGQGAEALLTPEGVVDIDALYDGTFDTADEIFAGVQGMIKGAPAQFEATSMMVHDPAILPDFKTPYDASISVAICNSPETVANMGLDELVAFMGFYAWKADPSGALSMTVPTTGREPIMFEVRDFSYLGAERISTVTVADGGTLRLEAPAQVAGIKIPPAMGAAVAAIVTGGLVWVLLIGGAPLIRRRA